MAGDRIGNRNLLCLMRLTYVVVAAALMLLFLLGLAAPGPIFVLASMNIPVVITIEAGLSFLGVGIRPPLASWGGLLHDGYTFLDQSPWLAVFSGLALMLATLGFTLLGEALRDAIDPKLRQSR